jgi:fructokinase
VTVRDAVGAGDSFTAALAVGWLRGWEMPAILSAATEVAGYVCTQAGATPRLPDELVRRFRG